MATIGSFGRARAQVDLDLDFFEAKIRAHPNASKAALTEFLADAVGISADDEPRNAKFIMDFLRELIHPDDFAEFWRIAKRERQDPMEDLLPIGKAIVEALSDFPTGQPSGSPSGSESTDRKFAVDLPSRAVPEPVLAAPTAADRALQMLRGRPDLQEFVVKQEEAEKARNGRIPAPG